jgi:general stress protein 26
MAIASSSPATTPGPWPTSSGSVVGLGYQGKSGVLGLKPFFLSVEGKAELIKDKARFAEHWRKDLDAWFKQGIDTPGLTLIKIHAERLHYWDGFDSGELNLAKSEAQPA